MCSTLALLTGAPDPRRSLKDFNNFRNRGAIAAEEAARARAQAEADASNNANARIKMQRSAMRANSLLTGGGDATSGDSLGVG